MTREAGPEQDAKSTQNIAATEQRTVSSLCALGVYKTHLRRAPKGGDLSGLLSKRGEQREREQACLLACLLRFGCVLRLPFSSSEGSETTQEARTQATDGICLSIYLSRERETYVLVEALEEEESEREGGRSREWFKPFRFFGELSVSCKQQESP